MSKFIKDVKNYFFYTVYSAKAELKSEIANSRLSCLWWVLDPLLFMLVYTFVVKVVFDRGTANFPVFVFIGLTVWNFFNKVLTSSVKLVLANKSIVSKVYIPKYILLIQKIFVYLFKMLISFLIIIVMLFFYKIPFTFTMLHCVILLIVLITVTFSISIFLLHFGIFVEDLSNVIKPLLRLMFYMSGIIYSIPDRISATYSWILLDLNPIALLANEFRNVIMYNVAPNYYMVGCWFLIALIFSWIGIRLIQKRENSYVKVI